MTGHDTTTHDTVARNTSIVLALVCLVLIGIAAAQRGQIKEMREIECSAYKERAARLILYDRIIDTQYKAGIDENAMAIVDAYKIQRRHVAQAAEASKDACDE